MNSLIVVCICTICFICLTKIQSIQVAQDGGTLSRDPPLSRAMTELRDMVSSFTTDGRSHRSALKRLTESLLNCDECKIPPIDIPDTIRQPSQFQFPSPIWRQTQPIPTGTPPSTSNSSSQRSDQLVESLKRDGIIRSPRVEAAMKLIDRADFTSDRNPYSDANLPRNIGYGATISAPSVHAHALEALEPKLKPGSRVLDVGSGSGYLAAAMSTMVGSFGKVIGIEHVPALVQTSIQNVRKRNSHLLTSGLRLRLLQGDGRLGYPAEAPYDAIHVGAAAATIPPALINHLGIGGRLIIPVGPTSGTQVLEQVDKLPNGTLETKSLMFVRFVPLTNQNNQYGPAAAAVHSY